MFQPGELLVYGTTGVCRMEGITRLDQTGPNKNKQYYVLKPLFQDGVIYSPVDHQKVPIRSVITREEADALIDLIPTLQVEACRAPTLQALSQYYQTAIRSHDCKDLMELMMSLYIKRQQAEAQNRHLGMVDERYMKQAERLLHGEFSAALGIPFEEVPDYIAKRVGSNLPDNT